MNQLQFRLPVPPNRGNLRFLENPIATRRQNTRYRGTAGLLMRQQLRHQEVPPLPAQRVHVRAVYTTWNHWDPDARVASLKPVLDALVDVGVVPDDRAQHVVLAAPEQHTRRIRQRKTEPRGAYHRRLLELRQNVHCLTLTVSVLHGKEETADAPAPKRAET